jgi:hypothetical protein
VRRHKAISRKEVMKEFENPLKRKCDEFPRKNPSKRISRKAKLLDLIPRHELLLKHNMRENVRENEHSEYDS